MRNLKFSGLLAIVATVLAACGAEPHMEALDNPQSGLSTLDTTEVEAILHQHIAVLASDEYEGRAPATPGEEKTISYLQREFSALGIQPGNGDSYFQSVSVTETTTASDAVLMLEGSDYQVALSYGDQMMVSSQQQIPAISVLDSELIFVGYGVVAPERSWNDYAGIDVTDKTVVILVNDPGYATQDPNIFNGNAMTYYGRWTYKYEEAARQGAAAALIVHETGPAGYGWEVVSSSWSGPQIGLQAANLNLDKVDIEGWLTLDSAQALFAGAGLSYQQLKAAAADPGFSAVAMSDITASVSISNSVRVSQSQNLIAMIPGSQRPEETIIYTGHWDHLGVNLELPGDNIYNGAADNATGTAALLALAKLHAAEPAPARSIVFLAVTAEESGLLGSRWYSENPVFPLEKTVANINMDNLNTFGPMRDIVVVGDGSSEMENYLKEAADKQNRYLTAEPNPERGYYYRSDHFNFAKVGVPALYAASGEDSREHGREWGAEQAQEYTDNRYHAPSDEYDPDWDLSGAAQDIFIYFDIANKLSQETTFPNWFEGNEFKAIRDASASAR
ncbi:MAG TPA: M28 family peptidase [Porticoccaceae bacterium]|jgi:Zn-dependent M28 family amino/carboxypeptidase|nr:M28 family peptidase [Gammaproteobacteria bacterium]HIL60044.1 M28 family peptidase [Porticoccaceae bacterium]